jgi:hypothetical protein
MQLTILPSDEILPKVALAIQTERLARYFPAAGGEIRYAFELYLWNCAICEAFFLPLHFCEILTRNAIHRALLTRGVERWFEEETFHKLLDARFKQELDSAINQEARQHGDKLTGHHIVSALTFGFWEHLTTKRFERYLWAKGIAPAFPFAPKDKTYQDVQMLIESVRRWRNRIAHHRAIFDKGPVRKHQDADALIKWICGDTASWITSVSRIQQAVALRPAPPKPIRKMPPDLGVVGQ